MLLHVQAQGLLQCLDARDNTIALTTFQEFYERTAPYRDMSIASLYLTVTSNMINASKTLDVFAATSGHWHNPQLELEDMPSWVPDWSREQDSIPLYWPLSSTPFNAAKGYPHIPYNEAKETRDGRKILVVRGRKIDTIQLKMEHCFEDLERKSADLNEMLCPREHCLSWLEHAERKGHPLLKEHTYESCKPLTLAMITAMTASFSSYSSFTSENIISRAPEPIYEELTFMLA
ncbi:MAG: hypothetical protein M1839_000540 [Geoglossum umbratile]|nr:MAG: hypothetical protein M1839_000540 [Geoglossum umbratile]